MTPGWAVLYIRPPSLLATTARALAANLDVINAIVEGRQIEVPRRHLRNLDRLLEEHIELTDDPELRAVFESYRSDLRDESIQRQFGVRVGE